MDKEALIKKYTPLIKSIVYKYAKDKDFFEDFLQEVFLTLWKTLDNYNPVKTHISSYIKMQINHTYYQYIRSAAHNMIFHPRAENYEKLYQLLKISIGSELDTPNLEKLSQLTHTSTKRALLAYNALQPITEYSDDNIEHSTQSDMVEHISILRKYQQLYDAIDQLPKHQKIYMLRYLSGDPPPDSRALKWRAVRNLRAITLSNHTDQEVLPVITTKQKKTSR